MIPFPRLTAARRVLAHFYWTKMRLRRGPHQVVTAAGTHIDLTALTAKDARIRVRATATGPVRLTTDAGTHLARPDAAGGLDVEMPGMRHLVWHDETSGNSHRLPLYRPQDHAVAALRAALGLLSFPLRHRRDLLDYFLRGDSEAGNRMERALLPMLAQAPVVPVAVERFIGPAPLPPLTAPVTLIVPIYNAAEVLAECLQRIAAHTPEAHRLILIDDASPDPRIAPMLRDFAARHPGTELLRNETNLGFIGSCNRGFDLATGHVVLLNSDALVPEGWLPRLLAPILVDAQVATVTPMSNDAEIFNAPVECRPRVLAEGEAYAADRAAARLDWRKAQAEAPTGVGFCMAMARPWLDRVGGFDPIFGRGYGEEVDWCCRASALGGRHLGLGTLFVEHRSGSSFGAEKSERVRENNAIVARRYPMYDLAVAQWRERDPLVGPRLAVALGMLDRGAALPVYMAHRLGGGAEHWLLDQIGADLRDFGAALVLRDDADSGRTLVELHSAQGVTRGLLMPEDALALLAIPARIRLVYSCLVGARDPLGFAGRCVGALRPDDRFELIFHDFLPLCPSYCLVSDAGRFCRLPGPQACQGCYERLPTTSGARPAQIADWRAGWLGLARRAERLVAFSADSRAQILKVWPELADCVEIRPHAIGHLPARIDPAPSKPGKVLTLGVLGGIGLQKGAGVLQDLARRRNPDLRIVVIGKMDPLYGDPGIIVHGAYDRDQISALAVQYGIDCWMIPSIWPETFSYTTHECLATGLPVFAFDLGAQADAVAAASNGHVVPLDAVLEPGLFRTALAARAVADVRQG